MFLNNRPAAVGFNGDVYFSHEAASLGQGDNYFLVMMKVLKAEGPALAVLEPFIADLIAAVSTALNRYNLRKQTTGSCANSRRNTEKSGNPRVFATAWSILSLTGSSAISGKGFNSSRRTSS